MSIRLLVWVLLIGATCASAAPPKKATHASAPTSTPPATADIDVDAMARAKDVGGSAATAPAATGDTAAAQIDNAKVEPPTDSGNPKTPPANEAAPAKAESAPEPDDTEMNAAPEADKAKTEAAATAEDAKAEAAAEADPATVPRSPELPQTEAPEARVAAACVARATALLDAAQKGDYAKATADFNAKMHSALPAEKLKTAWESLAQFGALQARGQSHPGTYEGYLVVTIPLIFEKKNLYAQTTCGSDGRIAGFFVKPLDGPTQ